MQESGTNRRQYRTKRASEIRKIPPDTFDSRLPTTITMEADASKTSARFRQLRHILDDQRVVTFLRLTTSTMDKCILTLPRRADVSARADRFPPDFDISLSDTSSMMINASSPSCDWPLLPRTASQKRMNAYAPNWDR
jgi:hypothetical protein